MSPALVLACGVALASEGLSCGTGTAGIELGLSYEAPDLCGEHSSYDRDLSR